MFDADIEEVFPMVSLGTKLSIITSLSVPFPGTTNIPGGKTYTVVVGDTLWKISKRLGINLAQLIAINNLTEPYTIYPGQTLLLP
jgi:LysM repeat protein